VRGVVPPRLRAAQAGISLVETLVALVLGLAMVSVAFNLYVSNRAVFAQVEAMVRLQESGSIAAALLETVSVTREERCVATGRLRPPC
jgi:Tfp pilus assembly protein PilW